MNKQERRELLAELMARVEERLDVGELQYGNTVLDRPALSLVREIREEIEDVVGWGAFLYHKMKRLEAMLLALQVDEPG